ncbi:MAG: transporter substrate-binding domain-containing protein [Thermodesulfobacteriota bacterium]|nr:transporter substrate-binding domain-containing protein [Thermodesulfobacteriota bacterium]
MHSRSFLATGNPFLYYLLILLISFSTFFPDCTSGSDARVVRVGLYDNPPKLFHGMQGTPKGIFPEIIEEIAKTENWKIEWVVGTWNEGLARLASGDIDIMPDVAYSLKRAEKYEFSDEPVLINWGTLYTHTGVQVVSIPDLAGKRIAVMRGSIHTDGDEGIREQVNKFNVSCEFIEFDTYQGVFQALQNNLADIGVVNRLYGTTSQKLYDVLPTKVAFNPRHLKFAFPPDGSQTPYLKKIIDQHLKTAHLQPASKISQIIKAYLPDIQYNFTTDTQQVHLTAAEKFWIKAHPTIRVGIDPEFVPFEFVDNNGEYSGFASDYIRLLNQRLGLNMQVVAGLTWNQVMTMAQQGKIDMLPAIGFSNKRTHFFSYTTPYIGFYRMIFSRSDAPFIADIRDLADLKVAVQAKSSHAAWIQEHTKLTPDYYNTLEETIKAVSEGKADVLIGNLAACTYWIRKLNLTDVRIAAPVSLERQLVHMAVRKDWPELTGILNKGLASISAQEVETIRNRWLAAGYNVGISSKIVWQRIGAASFLALLLVGFFWLWNKRLKQEIKLRKNAEIDLLNTQDKLEEKVTKRTRELEENKNYLQSIFDAPSEAVYIHDTETGAILDVNHAMLQMYGVTRAEALQSTIDDFSLGEYPYNQEEADKKIQLTLTDGPQTFEWLSKKKNGQLFWTEIGLKLTESDDRSYIIAVERDIDEKKKAEQVLAAEQERLAVTLRCIGDGVITTDTEGKIVLLNKVAEELTGWSNEDAQGRKSSEVFNIINEITGKKCKNPIEKVLEQSQTIGLSHHIALITKDGLQKSIADSGAPIRDSERTIIGVVLVFRDITNEKKMEKELLKIRKLESVGVLAGGIAHDFNNLLSAIIGNIELSLHLVGEDHKISPLLDNAQKASSRAAKLTQQLLTFSKGGEPVKETTSLPQLIQDSADFVLRGSPVSCSYDFADDLRLVDVDTGQISQVIQNIIINARQAMPEGGNIIIRCANVRDTDAETLLCLHTGDFVKVIIQDAGVGIPETIVEKIFDPYFSTKQLGSGLGLAICHSIISKHDGHITVHSTPDKGTTFTVYLPASDKPAGNGIVKKTTSQSSTPANIMVMDDDALLRDIAGSQLEHLGHNVVVVPDGDAAVQQYKELLNTEKHIDIIIMDLTIPGGMGGKEAVQHILNINPDAKVIVASGYSNDPVMADYKEYGFSASVAKPFDLQELEKAIASVNLQKKNIIV